MGGIILYDGVCNLCNQSVRFIIKRDTKSFYQFASLQGKAAKKLLQRYQIPMGTSSLIVIENGRWYQKSSAVLQIMKRLKGIWKLLAVGWFIPKKLRDRIYDLIARNRYRWFGKNDRCMVPTPELRNRFLDEL
ncbi:thiol-disulfide oxidoreductase DCC family protein [Aquibacillus sediminis]|uniref:thiol-disulfide oxidoreductase DCC family protein n=1 Tax=Aquibacillus sediminis TaxID=2574734 RepID=UPI001109D0B6|nr:DCC1-like thiol-disulfide oxidoreductase family protein [Aquibacillus sediminis]